MNILFCHNLDNLSGWGSLSLSYLKKLKNKKPLVFCSKKNPNIKAKQYAILKDPIKYISNPFLFYYDSKKIIEVIKFHKKKNSKISAHFLVEPYIFFTFFLNKIIDYNIFYVIGTYSNYFAKSLRWKFLFKLLFKKIHVVIFLSNYMKQKISPYINFVHAKSLILNPYIHAKKSALKKKEKNVLRVLSVGAIKKRKGYFELVKVISNLNIKYPNRIKLTIVGNINDKKYYEKIKFFIKKKKIESLVNIKINLNNSRLNTCYKNSDLFILASKEHGYNLEGYGIVYLEALSFGCEIMISKQSGATDIKEISNKFFIFNPNGLKDVQKKLKSYLIGKKINKRYNVRIFNKINHSNELKFKNFLEKF